MDNSKMNSELKKLKPLLVVAWLILKEINWEKYRSMCLLLGIIQTLESNILDLNHWRKDSECLCMWFAYNSHAYTKYHKPAASVGFLLKEKKADHCLSEGGEEWRAAAMHGLYNLLKSGTETRPYQELGSSTPTPPTYLPTPTPGAGTLPGAQASGLSGRQSQYG